MKKLLMCSAACVLGLAVAGPAKADGIKLDLAGHFKGYVTWINQDTEDDVDTRSFDMLRETEIHFTGETTLDNGLTVGVHHEADLDNESGDEGDASADHFATEESYAYFSGSWGRVNFGKEDGANYLLQVAVPSADENYDGLRQYINPTNLNAAGSGALAIGAWPGLAGAGDRGYINSGKLDYANDGTGYANKITYLTPVWSGFQAGASYTFDVGNDNMTELPIGGSPYFTDSSRAFGVHQDDQGGRYGDAWEAALRYEGKWQELGVTLGGGYTHVELEDEVGAGNTNQDDFTQWNLGGAFTWQQFGIGVAYTKDNGGIDDNGDNRTWVVGIDYTTGPFKIGGSYLDNDESLGLTGGPGTAENGSLDTHRWAAGVIYTYGPGMTFRGSVGWVNSDLPDEQVVDEDDFGSTDILLGTQINF